MTGQTVRILLYIHLTALALWMGGLLGYLMIVWPAIMSDATARFPRALLASIAIRTAPWIYSAMLVALLTFAAALFGGLEVKPPLAAGYGLILAGLIGNNVYGSVVAWPRMMLLPLEIAGREWLWFRVRMSAALVVGLALYCAGGYYEFHRR